MKTNKFKYLLLACAIFLGIITGSLVSQTNVYAGSYCGICDFHEGTQLTFCNTAYGGGQCGGNNGNKCPSVPCTPGQS